MKRIFENIFVIVICGIIMAGMNVTAQNNTNSPFTRYGYGQLEDDCFSKSQAMGGIAMGMRNKGSINPTNPASYSSIDSTSFIFEMGVSGIVSNFSSGAKQNTSFTGNLDYVALQSPITKWMGLSVGLIPFSYVGYNYSMTDSLKIPAENNTNIYKRSYFGKGGVSQLYFGLSFDIADHLAIGANGYYMFGNIDHFKSLSYSDSELATVQSLQKSNLHVSNFNVRFGLQYHETIGKKHAFTIGAIYEFRSKINGKYEQSNIGTDTIKSNSEEYFEMPSQYGAGFTYTYDNRLTVGVDYSFQEYSKAMFYGKRDSLCNRTKIAVGAEYINDPRGRRYVDRMYWRFGANYRNSYIKIGERQTSDFSITCGIGLPLRTSKTIININFEYGNIGSQQFALMKENYFKFGINFSLNEIWFVKAKLR